MTPTTINQQIIYFGTTIYSAAYLHLHNTLLRVSKYKFVAPA